MARSPQPAYLSWQDWILPVSAPAAAMQAVSFWTLPGTAPPVCLSTALTAWLVCCVALRSVAFAVSDEGLITVKYRTPKMASETARAARAILGERLMMIMGRIISAEAVALQ